MDYKVLYRKYRPQTFDDVSGQDYSMKILKNAVSSNKIAHAYLFTGPRGTGKTSTAKIFAKAINCTDLQNGEPCGKCASCTTLNNPDVIEIDAASNNGVDEIRELINNVKIAPSYSKYKVYIIDEVHMLSTSAFNALLLTLEEPPGNVVFILATTDVQNVPVTILSRCQRFDFKPISEDKIFNRLKYICENEKLSVTDDALKEIAYVANGGLRDALSILDQLSANKSSVDVDDVYQNFGTVSSIKIDSLVTSFINNDIDQVCSIINEFKENGINYTVLVEKIINKLKDEALNAKVANNNTLFDLLYKLIIDLNECLNSANININPYILIELTMVKYINLKNSSEMVKKDDEIISREIISEKNSENEIKNISREIILDKKGDNKEKKLEENIEDEVKEENYDVSDNIIQTRVNNCFVKANKQYKTEIASEWSNFIDYLEEKNASVYSLLIDTSVALASDEYIVLVDKNISTATLINKKLTIISDLYKEFNTKSYKFICLTEEKWNYNMDLYKKNKKDGIIYEYINEEDTDQQEKQIDEIENDEMKDIATDLFDSSVVEYE